MADDPAREMFELFQKMWNPFSIPVPDVFKPSMNVEEVSRKITELQAVENWLKMNLNVVQLTIRNLEAQKAALEPRRG